MTQRHWVQFDRMMFLTMVTKNRLAIFADPAKARIGVDVLYAIQSRYLFFLHGFVIMPDHCHLLLRVPEGGSISRIVHAYKRGVSFELGQGPLWQPRFDCRLVRDPTSVLAYIHCNPIVAGLSKTTEGFPWSSASGRWDIMAVDADGTFRSATC